MTARISKNPLRGPYPVVSPDPKLAGYHHRMPAYAPTLLFNAPTLAARLGVGKLLIKAETQRMGLPSFKILGASWATYQALCAHLGSEPEPWNNINELAANLNHLRPFNLAAATDGNHGRAVAFMARLLGFGCHIFVPAGMVQSRIEAIRREGATVTIVDGTYDDAVRQSAAMASKNCLVVSDTSWEGYEETPSRVIEGYSTIFREVDDALDTSGMERPDMVVIPMGVGAFMAAAVAHYRGATKRNTLIVGVEPIDANCIQISAEAGHITEVPGPHNSIMVGLNCGTPSLIAWPLVSTGVDWFTAVDDEVARNAMRELASIGIVAGETGAAALGGLKALLTSKEWLAEGRDTRAATVLLVVTEGATDPDAYAAITGSPPEAIGRVMTAT